MAHEEYLRRNAIHCKSVGAKAGVRVALERLTKRKDAPKWLVKQLEGVAAVLAALPGERVLAEKIHSATGMNVRCCTDAAREIRSIYE